jgi:hypothetical protein
MGVAVVYSPLTEPDITIDFHLLHRTTETNPAVVDRLGYSGDFVRSWNPIAGGRALMVQVCWEDGGGE